MVTQEHKCFNIFLLRFKGPWKTQAVRSKIPVYAQARSGLVGSKQLGFGDYEQTTVKKRTKRERFLSGMEKVVPWKALLNLIEPHYPNTSSKG